MRSKLIKISLIILILSILMVSKGFLNWMGNQVSASDFDTARELLAELSPLEFSMQGRVEGTGTYFEIKDSEYLNITLKSTEEIKVVLESIPKMISLDIESTSTATSTNLTLFGLKPNKTYYKYQDSYKQRNVFVSDEDGTIRWQQDLTQFHHLWFQEEKGTIFLPEKENKYGIWNESTKTYTLNQDLVESVEMVESNFTFDGNGHTISGNGTGYGIYVSWEKANNITIKNTAINNFGYGILLWFSWETRIENNFISNNNGNGLYLISSSEIILNNEINFNQNSGIYYYARGGETISGLIQGNNISNNGFGMYLHNQGDWLRGTSIVDNILNLNNYGLLLRGTYSYDLSSNNEIKNNHILNNTLGIYLAETTKDNVIYHNNFLNNTTQAHNEGINNLFDNLYPDRGNYWSDYTGVDLKSGPNQDQPGSDEIGDTPYTFTGGQDRYPFMKEGGWEVPVNQPPTIFNLGQFKSDGIISIAESDITTESTAVFKAVLNDPNNDQIKLQVELRQFNEPFTGINDGGILESGFVSSNIEAQIQRTNLVDAQYHWRARAVDDKGKKSDWQEFGTAGNVDFEIKLVPLYTQVRSPYPSDEETFRWFNEFYADGEVKSYTYGSKIRQCGCAITSVVMIARYYDITESQGKDVNPKEINEWLKSEPGGYQKGDINWIAAAKYTNWRIKYEKTDKAVNNYVLLNDKLNNNQPVIAKEKSGRGGINREHFIVIDNKLASMYGIKDPAWYNTKILDEPISDDANKIRDYENGFDGLRIYKKGDGIAQAAITFALGSQAELLITDSLGRKLGKDQSEIEYNEISDASYFEDGFDDPTGENPPTQERNKLIQILEPTDGQYQLQVIGTGAGSYTLQSTFYDTKGNSQNQEFHSETAPDYTAQYNLSFNSTNSASTTIELFDETPPEAEIYFDSIAQGLTIKGTDNTTVNPIVSVIESDKKQNDLPNSRRR